MTPFPRRSPIQEALPERALRNLRDAYEFSDFLERSPCLTEFLQLVDNLFVVYGEYTGVEPSPLILRALVAAIVHDRDEVTEYINRKVPLIHRSSSEQLADLAAAIAGSLVALWIVDRGQDV